MSTVKVDNLSNLAASKSRPTADVLDGAARAWVNFDGTGTVAIRKAFNVSSITDNGAGDYTPNFSSPLPDANYAVFGSAGGAATSGIAVEVHSAGAGSAATLKTTTQCRILCSNTTGAADNANVSVGFFD